METEEHFCSLRGLDNLVAACLRKNLRGAVQLHRIGTGRIDRPGYWERSFTVAWERDFTTFPDDPETGERRNCGVHHNVCVNSKGEYMATGGRYDLTKTEALKAVGATTTKENT